MRFLQAQAVWPNFSEVPPKLHFGLNFSEEMFVTPEQHRWRVMCSGVPLELTSPNESSANQVPQECQARFLIFWGSTIEHHVSNGVWVTPFLEV